MIAIERNGTIETFASIPSKWNNTLGYNYEDASVHYIDGFRDVVEPSYNSTTQYKGVMVYDAVNNVFTYVVIDYTVEQLAGNVAATETKTDRNDQEILENKGLKLYEKSKDRFIRRNKKGLITKARAKKVREYLSPIFFLLKTGDIDLANDKALLLPTDANADVNGELVWFKAQLATLLIDVNNLL